MELNKAITAVVVGGASGLGAATVRALRHLEVAVTILDRDAARGEALAQATGAGYVTADVCDEDSVVRGFKQARARQGQERILVHTPATGAMMPTASRDATSGTIQRHDFRRFQEVVNLNLNGTFLCASVSAAGMLTLDRDSDGDRGVIVMTSSIASIDAPVNTAAYAASKAGINGLTLAMARDFAPEGIRVNTILPGSFDTPLTSGLPQPFMDAIQSSTLHPKRMGRPEEFASMVMEFIRNSYLNAALLRLDGAARLG